MPRPWIAFAATVLAACIGVVPSLRASPAQAACDDKAEPKVDWHGCDRHGANLSGAKLSGANLSGAKLSGANLTNAKLNYVYLVGAKLTDADLSGATWTDGEKKCAAGSIGKCN
jgi:uncharacterized protein YjbI with pentapeptide repeats